MRIMICDDTVQPLTAMVDSIQRLAPKGSAVECLTGPAVSQAAQDLERRRRSASGRHSEKPLEWGAHPFDQVDLLFLDYNFVELENTNGLTGSRLAYLARCYSGCKFIVVLNQFGRNRFDLTLRDHPDTAADLHLGSSQMDNPGLWGSNDWPDFRPWTWPVLPDAIARLERVTSQVSGNPDAQILQFLGLSNQIGAMPRSVRQFLVRDGMTFNKLVFESEAGFDDSDKPFDVSVVPRLAGALVVKWLEHMVLSAQDVMVDFPRLLSRYPSLLTNATFESLKGKALTPDFLGKLVLQSDLEEHRFKKIDWLPKDAWFRHPLLSDDRIRENADTAAPNTDLRFAEDSSRFIAKEEATGFVADLSSPFVQRFVRANREAEVEYQPQLRFAL